MRTVFMGVAAVILLLIAGADIWLVQEEKSLAQNSDAPLAETEPVDLLVAAFDDLQADNLTSLATDERPVLVSESVKNPPLALSSADPLPLEPLGVDNPPTTQIVISSRETALPEPVRIESPETIAFLDQSTNPEFASKFQNDAVVALNQPNGLNGANSVQAETPQVDLQKPLKLDETDQDVAKVEPEVKTPVLPAFLPKSIYPTPKRNFPQLIAEAAQPAIQQERKEQLAVQLASPLSSETQNDIPIKLPPVRPAGLGQAPAVESLAIADFSNIDSDSNPEIAPSETEAGILARITVDPVLVAPNAAPAVLPKTDESRVVTLLVPETPKQQEVPSAAPKVPSVNPQASFLAEQPKSDIAPSTVPEGAPTTQPKTAIGQIAQAPSNADTNVVTQTPKPTVKKKVVRKKVARKKAVRSKKKVTSQRTRKATTGSALSAKERSALSRSIAKCYRAPASAKAKPELRVRMRVGLTKDGFITSSPKFLSGGGSKAANDIYNSVRRALIRCQPYKLPAAKYTDWRSISITASASSIGAR